MAVTPSNMLALGTAAPAFELPDVVSGKMVRSEQLRSDVGTVVMFICNHCPYVKHVNQQLVRLAQDYLDKGIAFVAISSNDAVKYPEDGPHKMKEVATRLAYPFPYLYDESQEVAKAYRAACTPDFYLFDAQLKLIYRGQLDDSRPGNNLPVTGKDLRKALDLAIEKKPLPEQQVPSIGCNIKWK